MAQKFADVAAGLKHGDTFDCPMMLIVPNDWNPNEMSMDEFNMLSENIEDVDFLDPVLVVPTKDGMFRIVDGEHRYEAMRLRDATSVKAIFADPEKFDEDTQKFQTVRMNKIRGKLNTKKFTNLVSGLMEKGTYSYDELAHNFGFSDESEFDTLIERTRESLPSEDMKREFDKSRDDIRTVDDLSLVLNRLFTKYGDSLPCHFMVLDFGGKDHLWVRMRSSEYRAAVDKARDCMAAGVTFDSVLALILRNMNATAFVDKWRDKLEAPDAPDGKGTSIDDLIDREDSDG